MQFSNLGGDLAGNLGDEGLGGQAGSQVWPRGDQGAAASRHPSPTAGFLAVLELKAKAAPSPRGSSMGVLKKN